MCFNSLPTTDDFLQIVLSGTDLIDVRAPVEFAKGSFMGAVNLPLLTDEERHIIGLAYKRKGREKAIELGHELVSGSIKEERINRWRDFISTHPESSIFCFRGGMRSQLSQKWIFQYTGKAVPLIKGGYKAFRKYLVTEMEKPHPGLNPLILGGRTGTGKTILLKEFNYFLDLEKIANHRGSSFGGFTTPQPSLVDFEHNLAFFLIRHIAKGSKTLLLEDEGRHIGRCYLPPGTYKQFNMGKLIILEAPISERIQIIFDEYVTYSQSEYATKFGVENGLLQWEKSIVNSFQRIKKRLGGVLLTKLLKIVESAIGEQHSKGDSQGHKAWIKLLLSDYYDPMYDYQLQKRVPLIQFRGTKPQIIDYIKNAQ
jgi:tRNA 2-selenouridine synthase